MNLNLPNYSKYRDEVLHHKQFPLKPINNGSIDKRYPLISVITPSYNQGKYIEKTILSIIEQDYPNIEYIIMDGGSTDETIELIKKYENKISYWESKKDRGQGHAINKGFSIASGDIYCWINSDDYFLEGVFKKVAQSFINTKADAVYGNCYNLKNEVLEKYYSRIIFDRYLCIPGIAQPSVFWKSSIHQPIWEDLHCTLDFELWMRMLKGTKKKFLDEFLSVALVHGESKTHSEDLKMKAKWQADHELQWRVHGPINNWNSRQKENYYIQKIINLLRLKKMYAKVFS